MPLLPLQVLLLLVALVAVPWMLIPKPYILKKRHEARQAQVPCSQHQQNLYHTMCLCLLPDVSPCPDIPCQAALPSPAPITIMAMTEADGAVPTLQTELG